MAVPKKKQSKSRTNKRRGGHDGIETPQMMECNHCGGVKIMHRACPNCGYYRGRQVITPRSEY